MAYGGKLRRQALHRVLVKGDKVARVAKDFGISRKTLHSWISRYKKAPSRLKKTSVLPQYKRGKNHPRAKAYFAKSTLIYFLTKNPSSGSRKLSKELKVRGIELSNHATWELLKKLDLTTEEKREVFSQKYSGPRRLSAAFRQEALEQVQRGVPVSTLAQKYHISRKAIYAWIAWGRVEDAYLSGFEHPKSLGPQFEKRVLGLVAQNPALSSHKIAPAVGASNHGVYSVLKRNGLTLYEQRIAFARSRAEAARVPVFSWLLDRIRLVWETFVPALAPAPPPLRLAPLAQGKLFLASTTLTTLLTLTFIWWIRLLSSQPLSTAIGLFFATIALTIGSFFFAYSMKYYFTLAIVLSFSQQTGIGVNGNSQLVNGKNGKRNGMLSWILGLANGNGKKPLSGPVGLEPSLEHVKLSRQSFVSIHLPFYNEKNVAERILSAVTSFDYPNYEVVIVDDSTDETTQIVRQFVSKQQSVNGNKPKIKLIHRSSRAGFKGGALGEALRHTDKRAEFVIVFDADFVPYPDTIKLFLKYFQVTAGTLEFQKGNRQQAIGNSREQNTSAQSLVPSASPIAAVQGYQWHVLNKSENWITRGVRSEYAGSYVIERSGNEILGALKMIAGSVYMVRRDLLDKFGWETSITEDFQLTLKLYEAGYKVVYTPYIQAPAECVSTIRRLVRQRMRWAEGHSHNVRKMFLRLIRSPNLTIVEKIETLYLSPYYLQAFFFVVGTLSWLLAETVFPARLPFWTSLWGWSLVLTNLLSLPLMNTVGLFLEEAEERDYIGALSFIALSYILVPFQAYAAIKGFIEREEGPWFRTPKTGKITDIITRARFYRLITGILPGRVAPAMRMNTRMADIRMYSNNLNSDGLGYVALATANNRFNSFSIRPRRIRWFSKATLAGLLIVVLLLNYLSFFTPGIVRAAHGPHIEQQINIIDQEITAGGTDKGIVRIDTSKYSSATYYFEVVAKVTSGSGTAVLTYDAGTVNIPSGGLTLTISNITATSYTRYPSASFSPTGNQNAYVSSLTGTGISVKAARIIIVQSDATNITDTQTQIELGDAQSFLNQSYTALTNHKYFLLDKNKYDDGGTTINAYFEASMQAVAGGTTARASFMSGFETGDTIEWTSGTAGVTTVQKRSGAYGLSLNDLATPEFIQTDSTGAPSSYGIRYGLRLLDSTPSSNQDVTTIYCDSSATWTIFVLTDGKVRVTQNETSTNFDSTSTVFSDNTWHLMEFKGNAAQGTSGSFGLRVDGVEVLAQSNLDGCAGIATIMNPVRFDAFDTGVGDVWLDDVFIITSNAYPGDGKIVKLQPNASGDEGPNNWVRFQVISLSCISQTDLLTTAVNETPKDNFVVCDVPSLTDDSYIRNNVTAGGTILFNLQDASVGGIGANGTINDVWYRMWAKRGNGSGTVHAIRKKWAGTASSSGDCALDTTGKLCSLQESGTLSVTNVNSAQLGGDKQSGGREMDVETLWMMVDYTPMPTVKARLESATSETGFWTEETSVTSTSTSWSRVRTASILGQLADDQLKRVAVDVDGAVVSQNIANAKLIIEQTAAGGLTKLETVQQYNNTLATDADSTYTSQNYMNNFNKTNFAAGTFTAYFETTIKTSNATNAYFAQLDTPLGEVTGTDTSYTRKRNATDLWASLPGTATNIDVQLKNNSTDTTSSSTSWLIIDVTNLQIPENLIFFIPFALFLPILMRWFKARKPASVYLGTKP